MLYPLLVTKAADVDLESPAPQVPRNSAIEALREIEFDRATGKLSETDYNALKSSYTQRAVETMRGTDTVVCPNCGPRPEQNAVFCSNCGTPLGLQEV